MADAHHDEEHIHMPAPSIWPLILVVGIGHLPLGLLLIVHEGMLSEKWLGVIARYQAALGWGAVLFGALVCVAAGFGWAGSIIKEKYELDIAWGNRVLSQAWKLFLLSEAAIFGSFFGHYYYTIYQNIGAGLHWPPLGTPPIHLVIPAVGTGVLVLSSLTCELGHKALIAGNRAACKTWLVLTLLLGFSFISMQGYEWGYLMTGYGFTPAYSVLGTQFYLITGFHGFHVMTGLLFLSIVYARLEMGSFDRRRHFSLNAASWYWHFVDVIWLLVFFTLYVGVQHH